MFAAHAQIVCSWLLLTAIFYGWGTLACRLGRCDRDDAVALIVNPWIGVACVIGLLQAWNFFAPIGFEALSVVAVVGLLAGILFGIRYISPVWHAARANPVLFAIGGLVFLWLANRSLNTQDFFDHGLYYLNAIRWASDYPIVPGLANLHNRLAFNNSSFLLHAMLEPAIGRGYSAHLLNGMLTAWTIPIFLGGLRSIFSGSGNERQAGWFTLALAMIVATSAIDRRISSATPDYPAMLFITLAVWRLLATATSDMESTGQRLRWNLTAIALLATAAVTLKTTVIFFAALAGIALAACLHRLARERSPHPLQSTILSLGWIAPWCLLLFAPWVARGYVLSGYPLFPSTIGGAPVDWAYDLDAAAQLRNDIYAWARTFHGNVETGYQPGWGWVPGWAVQVILLRAPVEVVAPAAISVVSACWLVWNWAKSRGRGLQSSTDNSTAHFVGYMLGIAYAASLVLWFVTAPSPRMGSFAWWGLATISLGLASRRVPVEWLLRHRRLVIAGLGTLFVLPMLDEAVRVEFRYRKNPNMPEYGRHFYEFHPFVLSTGEGKFPPLPKGELVESKTNSNLTVWVARPRAEGTSGQPWDSPLPAVPSLNPRLSLRQPGELRSGFRIRTSTNSNETSPKSP